MTIVVDASAAVRLLAGLIADDDTAVFDDELLAPDLFVAEVGTGLRRAVFHEIVTRHQATLLLHQLLEMPIDLEPTSSLIERAFDLFDNVSVADGCYVALAEQHECAILTSDERLARATGIDVPFVVV